MDYFAAGNSSSDGSSSFTRNNGVRDKIKGGGGGGGKNKSKGVRLSTDPQSVAARERRHRISDRFKILQSLVPGGTKMDTVSMLEEAIHYVKFLKTQIWLHQTMINFADDDVPFSSSSSPSVFHQYQLPPHQDHHHRPAVSLGDHLPHHDHQQADFCGHNNFVSDPVLPPSPATNMSLAEYPSCFQGQEIIMPNNNVEAYMKYYS